VDRALAGGGPDNISVIVIRVAGPHTETPTVQLTLKREA
jgi:serine/threonine protein phosphatase PrpC